MRILFAALAFAALGVFICAQVVAGTLGLAHVMGPLGAVAGLGAALLLRFTLPLRVGAVIAAVSLWHWPLVVALAFAAPRWLLMVPGLVSTWIAQRRHPRPLWKPLPGHYHSAHGPAHGSTP